MRGRGIGHKLCPSPTLHTPHHTLISHKMCLLPPYLPPSVPVTNCAPYPVSLGINKLGIQNVSVAGGEAQLVLVLNDFLNCYCTDLNLYRTIIFHRSKVKTFKSCMYQVSSKDNFYAILQKLNKILLNKLL